MVYKAPAYVKYLAEYVAGCEDGVDLLKSLWERCSECRVVILFADSNTLPISLLIDGE